jgi:excisionase family DNA binding protein
METLLTVQQICDQLQVSDQTVRRWIKSRELPATNLGGKAGYRVKASDLTEFLERRAGKVAA